MKNTVLGTNGPSELNIQTWSEHPRDEGFASKPPSYTWNQKWLNTTSRLSTMTIATLFAYPTRRFTSLRESLCKIRWNQSWHNQQDIAVYQYKR
ncbi:hypothetical protein C0J52_05806 [Blattella germanica]|nr:hypothetical protein C0J52_05806 [Blattella germanica]